MRSARLTYAITSLAVGAILMPAFGVFSASAQRVKTLDNVTVTARRPMKEIGIQKTVMDSAALKDNIALSMADILTYNSSVFVKSYGRATLSTVAFRGTSPSTRRSRGTACASTTPCSA